MTKTIRFVLAFLTMAAGAVFLISAANSAQASPYGHPFTCNEITRVRPNGVTIVTLRCSGQLPSGEVRKYQCRLAPVPKPCKGPLLPAVVVVLHSKPQVLGAFSPDANGVVNATVTIPNGFTGNHTVEARLVTKSTKQLLAPELSEAIAAQTTRVMLPLTVGKASAVSRSSAAALPVTDTGSSFGSVAVVGIGALGVVMLVGGGLLMFTGRRRRTPA